MGGFEKERRGRKKEEFSEGGRGGSVGGKERFWGGSEECLVEWDIKRRFYRTILWMFSEINVKGCFFLCVCAWFGKDHFDLSFFLFFFFFFFFSPSSHTKQHSPCLPGTTPLPPSTMAPLSFVDLVDLMEPTEKM